MTWWSNSSTEPKRKNRFLVYFGTGGYLFSVSSVSKPTVSIETKEYRLINHFYKYPGVPRWEGISIKFVDAGVWGNASIDVGGKPVETGNRSTSQTLWEMLLASGYLTPTTPGIDGRSVTALPDASLRENRNNPRRLARVVSPEKAAMIDRSFGSSTSATDGSQLQIIQLNARGEAVERWTLYNPLISKISWGDLDYGDDGLVECTLDVVYDWAELDSAVTVLDLSSD